MPPKKKDDGAKALPRFCFGPIGSNRKKGTVKRPIVGNSVEKNMRDKQTQNGVDSEAFTEVLPLRETVAGLMPSLKYETKLLYPGRDYLRETQEELLSLLKKNEPESDTPTRLPVFGRITRSEDSDHHSIWDYKRNKVELVDEQGQKLRSEHDNISLVPKTDMADSNPFHISNGEREKSQHENRNLSSGGLSSIQRIREQAYKHTDHNNNTVRRENKKPGVVEILDQSYDKRSSVMRWVQATNESKPNREIFEPEPMDIDEKGEDPLYPLKQNNLLKDRSEQQRYTQYLRHQTHYDQTLDCATRPSRNNNQYSHCSQGSPDHTSQVQVPTRQSYSMPSFHGNCYNDHMATQNLSWQQNNHRVMVPTRHYDCMPGFHGNCYTDPMATQNLSWQQNNHRVMVPTRQSNCIPGFHGNYCTDHTPTQNISWQQNNHRVMVPTRQYDCMPDCHGNCYTDLTATQNLSWQQNNHRVMAEGMDIVYYGDQYIPAARDSYMDCRRDPTSRSVATPDLDSSQLWLFPDGSLCMITLVAISPN